MVDALLATSRADHQRQMRHLLHREVKYRGKHYRVIDAMGEGERFGLFMQETQPDHGIAAVLIVSGDDLRGVQLP
jgi:hypothetical protein